VPNNIGGTAGEQDAWCRVKNDMAGALDQALLLEQPKLNEMNQRSKTTREIEMLPVNKNAN